MQKRTSTGVLNLLQTQNWINIPVSQKYYTAVQKYNAKNPMFKITYKFVFWIGKLSEQRKLSAGFILKYYCRKKMW